jgi:hypothetical protein
VTFRFGTTDGPGGGWRLGTSDRQAFAAGAASITSVTGSASDVVRSGETVTIVGTNFEAAQGTGTVTIGGVAVDSYTSWSDTEIVAVAPAEGLMFTGTKTVTVTPDTNDPGQRGGISYLPLTGYTFKRLTTTTIPDDSLAAGATGLAIGDEVYTESTWTRDGGGGTATWNWNTEGDGTGYLSAISADGDYSGDVDIRDATDGTDSSNGPKTVTIDTVAPSGYTVNWDQVSINGSNETAASFTFAGAEVGTDYSYTITSSGGIGSVSDTGTIATATDQITGIDVSSLPNGDLTLSVTLTDSVGQTGTAATDQIHKGALEFTDGPAALSVGSTSVRIRFTASGDSTITYGVVVLANGAGVPSAADVLAGTVSGAVAELTAQTALDDVEENTASLAGLEASTAYDVYVAIDDGFSDPVLGTRVDITTNAPSQMIRDVSRGVCRDPVRNAA